ncbi:MAG: flagellar basal body rod protein FlgB [Gammaproteobacteria bacterium]|nr:flagellar basal body rod protein FlgB [Gammaproteobacteria bacterium]
MPKMDDVLGIHEYALKVRAKRTELIASNLANADTPNYKARDIDFKTMLQERQRQLDGRSASAGQLKTTHSGHIANPGFGPMGEALYRVPLQASIDGNTVDTQQEKGKFMENSIQYQATVNFISDRVTGLKQVLKGQG